MKLTHIVLTREDGSKLELTSDEARQLWSQLGLILGQPSIPLVNPIPGYPYPRDPIWTTPIITCGAASAG